MLASCANGFGALALAALLREPAFGGQPAAGPLHPTTGPLHPTTGPLSPRPTHFQAKAASVIFLYMDGGVSQVDSFDPKPRLEREHGRPIKMKIPPTQFNDVGNVLMSPWAFRRYGQCGTPVSDLFPHTAQCVDDLCVVRSMVSRFSEHTNANYFLHTGSGLQGRPSMGSWFGYGLGSECQDLPGFVVLNGGLIPPGGLDNFGSGFLPASYQGSVFKQGPRPLDNVARSEANDDLQRGKLALLDRLDQAALAQTGRDDQLESAIANYELAFRMQAAVPDLMDLSREDAATRRLYGLEAEFEATRSYGALCLIARRLVERGVRFVELTCPHLECDRWDQHSHLKDGHAKNALAVDQPIAALLLDLKRRGLLESTLVVWAGEFGRTPMAQGSDGRDHNPFGFTIWMAGGGVKGGAIYGATDEYGYYAVENRLEIHDLHATMLHLLGIDHTRLTYRFGGRDVRLTDVHGNVVRELLA
ncbi:MAG TPA: DUF1501 domain-containing protein [Pirellulales bacterium]|nr:DUF1501 domain-containing protein [Pirellulales bacterium]